LVHPIAQIHCCHWDLGKFRGVCGEPGGGSTRNRLLAPQQALALPFDPLPSAFERWLNAKRDWPNNQRLRFAEINECADQSVRLSPYRMPVYTCLNGSVAISAPGQATRQCRLQRVSFFPSMQRVRYWTESCR
jgi:hypothetical protein